MPSKTVGISTAVMGPCVFNEMSFVLILLNSVSLVSKNGLIVYYFVYSVAYVKRNGCE